MSSNTGSPGDLVNQSLGVLECLLHLHPQGQVVRRLMGNPRRRRHVLAVGEVQHPSGHVVSLAGLIDGRSVDRGAMQDLVFAGREFHETAQSLDGREALVGQYFQQIRPAFLSSASRSPQRLDVAKRFHEPAKVRLCVPSRRLTAGHRGLVSRVILQRLLFRVQQSRRISWAATS